MKKEEFGRVFAITIGDSTGGCFCWGEENTLTEIKKLLEYAPQGMKVVIEVSEREQESCFDTRTDFEGW